MLPNDKSSQRPPATLNDPLDSLEATHNELPSLETNIQRDHLRCNLQTSYQLRLTSGTSPDTRTDSKRRLEDPQTNPK